jgi:MOSC domain-containing protein YiiM
LYFCTMREVTVTSESSDGHSASGRVRGLAIHGPRGEPMIEVEEIHVTRLAGLQGDRSGKGKRGVTLLSQEHWSQVTAALRADLPWHTRRANVLVEGLQLSASVGRRLRLGEVELYIHGETRPCEQMDRLHPGLRRLLETDCRGGVHGQVSVGGHLKVGDAVFLVQA